MAKEIIDSALANQFMKYLDNKGKKLSQLSQDEIKQESQNFLQDKYPGFQNTPNKLIELMASPSADKALENSAIVNPEDEKTCQTSSRKKRSISINCPDNWYRNLFGECLIYVLDGRPFTEAQNYCANQHPDAHLFIFSEENRFATFYNDLLNDVGGYEFSHSTGYNGFWLDARLYGNRLDKLQSCFMNV